MLRIGECLHSLSPGASVLAQLRQIKDTSIGQIQVGMDALQQTSCTLLQSQLNTNTHAALVHHNKAGYCVTTYQYVAHTLEVCLHKFLVDTDIVEGFNVLLDVVSV